MKHRWIALPIFATLVALIPLQTRAAESGVLSGTVRDTSGGAVVHAQVSLMNHSLSGNGVAVQRYTDQSGAFDFNELAPGDYTVKVEADNFEATTRQVVVGTKPARSLDITLAVRGSRSEITVRDGSTNYSVAEDSAALKTDAPLLLTPQSVQVISRAVLEDQNTLTLTDAVRNIAGVSSDFGFNGNAQPLLILRGFPSASMTARGGMSGSSTYFLDGTKVQGIPVNMADVQTVQVVKGPATVLYGRAEPGGLVNVVSRPLIDIAHCGFEQTVTQFGTSRSLLEMDHPLNRSGSLLGRFAGSWLYDRNNRDFVRNELGAATGVVGWRPNSRTQLTLGFDYQHQGYRNDYGVPAIGNRPADLPWSRQFNNSNALSTIDSRVLRIQGTREISSKWTVSGRVLSLWGGFSENDLTPYRYNFTTGANCLTADGSLCRYYYYVRPDGASRINQTSVDLKGSLRTGFLRHDLLVGFDYYSTDRTGTQYLQQVSSINVFAPVFSPVAPLDTATTAPLNTVDQSRWASGYLQDVINLGFGVRVMAGVRFDGTKAIYADPGTPANNKNFVTPRAGLVWQFAAQQALYFQFQKAVDANNGRDPVTKQALLAERSKQFEAGYKLSLAGGGLNVTAALYQLTKTNRADYSLYPTVRTIGDARSRGFELDASGKLMKRLSAITSYSFIQALVTNDPSYQGTTLANVPKHSGSLWLRYSATQPWAFGAGVFSQSIRQGNIENSFQLPGYARADVMTSYQFHIGEVRSSVQLNVNNLLDRKYYTGSHQLVSDWIQVAAARTFALTLRFDK